MQQIIFFRCAFTLKYVKSALKRKIKHLYNFLYKAYKIRSKNLYLKSWCILHLCKIIIYVTLKADFTTSRPISIKTELSSCFTFAQNSLEDQNFVVQMLYFTRRSRFKGNVISDRTKRDFTHATRNSKCN